MRPTALFVLLLTLFVLGCSTGPDEQAMATEPGDPGTEVDESDLIRSYDQIPIAPAEPTVVHTDEEWREILSGDQYHILRDHGTEPPYSGELLDNDQPGVYRCAGCDHALFSSQSKYDSGTGWPSYYEPIDDDAVGTAEDHSLGTFRVEVHCGQCAGHLGHVFPDGPAPTGLRYCINSLAMTFDAED